MSTSPDTPLYLSNPVKPAIRSPHYVPFADIERTMPLPPPPSTPGFPPPPQPLTPFPYMNTAPQQLLLEEERPPPQPVLPTPPPSPPGLGSTNVRLTCRYCRNEIQTIIEKKPSLLAWISVGVIALCGGIFGCCLIPLCVDSCMDTYHTCPTCGAPLGKHKALDL